MKPIKQKIENISKFLMNGIWSLRISKLEGAKARYINTLRVVLLLVRGYKEDKISLRASSLTFLSLMSIVPVMAMAFGVAKGFGLDAYLEAELGKLFSGQEEVLKMSVEFANSMLNNTQGGLIAGFGLIVLFFTVIQLLSSIEESFNGIWGIKQSRVFIRKFTDYFALMLLAPLLFVLASSSTFFITSQLRLLVEGVGALRSFTPFLINLLQFVPYTIIWLLFTLLYLIVPNTKVTFKSALIAGVVAGSVYQLTQWGYINFQIGFSRYGAIYGSFAALPLFLVWLQLSWLIILLGSELSFAIQNVRKYEFGSESLRLSNSLDRKLSLSVAAVIIKQFAEGKAALNDVEISDKLHLPIRIMRKTMQKLVDAGIVSQTVGEEVKESYYQPAQDIGRLSIHYVIKSLDSVGMNDIKSVSSIENDSLDILLSDIENLPDQSEANVLLKDL